jgi:Rrf2 family iron-sulfur cluster assembly transcriptional regulator
MNLNKSTRYGLYAAMEMAGANGDRAITVGEVAVRYRIPEGALAKAFQQLVRAGIASGTRGVGGGYRLARRASEVTILDVLNAFEPPRPPGRCLLAEPAANCHASPSCRLRRLFDEVDELARNTYASITLETLLK